MIGSHPNKSPTIFQVPIFDFFGKERFKRVGFLGQTEKGVRLSKLSLIIGFFKCLFLVALPQIHTAIELRPLSYVFENLLVDFVIFVEIATKRRLQFFP